MAANCYVRFLRSLIKFHVEEDHALVDPVIHLDSLSGIVDIRACNVKPTLSTPEHEALVSHCLTDTDPGR